MDTELPATSEDTALHDFLFANIIEEVLPHKSLSMFRLLVDGKATETCYIDELRRNWSTSIGGQLEHAFIPLRPSSTVCLELYETTPVVSGVFSRVLGERLIGKATFRPFLSMLSGTDLTERNSEHRHGHLRVRTIEEVLDLNGRQVGTVGVFMDHMPSYAQKIEVLRSRDEALNSSCEVPREKLRTLADVIQNFLEFTKAIYNQKPKDWTIPALVGWSVLSKLWGTLSVPIEDENVVFCEERTVDPSAHDIADDLLFQLCDLLTFLDAQTCRGSLDLSRFAVDTANTPNSALRDLIIAHCSRCFILLDEVMGETSACLYDSLTFHEELALELSYCQEGLFKYRFLTAVWLAPPKPALEVLLWSRAQIVYYLTKQFCQEHGGAPEAISSELPGAALFSSRGFEADKVFELVQESFDTQESPSLRDIYRRILTGIVQSSDRLPSSLIVDDVSIHMSQSPIGSGGYATVYHGQFDGRAVAIKVVKNLSDLSRDADQRRSFYLEVLTWWSVQHPRLLPFLGMGKVMLNQGDAFGMIAPYMQKENAREKCDKEKPPRVHPAKFLLEIAEGMAYLHREGVVHGDLRGVNALVDESGGIRVADFGLCIYANGISKKFYSIRSGNTRWTAPELLSPARYYKSRQRKGQSGSDKDADEPTVPEGRVPTSRPTMKGDVYSFACVCIELFGRRNPYEDFADLDVVDFVTSGKSNRDTRPPEMPDKFWSIVQQCWAHDLEARPTFDRLLVLLTS